MRLHLSMAGTPYRYACGLERPVKPYVDWWVEGGEARIPGTPYTVPVAKLDDATLRYSGQPLVPCELCLAVARGAQK